MAKVPTPTWAAVMSACLKKRIPVHRFEEFAENLCERNIYPQPSELTKSIADSQSSTSSGVDPLVPLYVECMLKNGWIEEAELLELLFKNFQKRMVDFYKQSTALPEASVDSKYMSLQLEEILFTTAVNGFAAGTKPSNIKQANATLKIAIAWVTALVEADRSMLMGTDSLTQQVYMARVALGTLMAALLGNPKIRDMLDSSSGSDLVKQLKEPLAAFIPLVNQISPQISHRLEYLVHDFMPTTFGSQNLGLSVGDLSMGNVIDGSAVQSRASVFVYLESLFRGWPSADDQTVLTYIHARYKGDIDSSISDLIIASFDLNSVAASRGDSPRDMSMYRLFLTERLPHLVLALTTETYVPFDITFLLPELFQRVTATNVLRQEFLLACTLHGLLSENNIENILGSKPTQGLPKGGKATRENLIQEYRKDPSRAEHFVSRVGFRDGNSGTYAEVVLEIVNHLCAIRDTMSLSGLCNAIACNPDALDAIAIVSTPIRLLSPIFRLLDAWGHEEDQGEYQPVYDEYGACFLLVMTCTNRFGLKASDLDGVNATGLVAYMLDVHGAAPSSINSLTPDQNKHLTGWVCALFETEGISDELMSTCPPQDFYKIVPTIFSQSIIACRSDVLDMEKIKNGLELLLKPFLLPSIILGVRALAIQAWAQPTDASIILRILEELIMPTSDRSPTHSVVLSIIANDLSRTLLDLRHRGLQSEDVTTLLDRLQPVLQSSRSTDQNTNNTTSATLATLPQDLHSLFSWTFTPTTPPTYTHARLHTVLNTSGGIRVLDTILTTLKSLSQPPVLADVALDIAASLICMPDKRHCATAFGAARCSLSRLTLHDALQLEAQDVEAGGGPGTKMTGDTLRAELITKLAHRVSLYPVSVPLLDMTAPLPSLLDSTLDIIDPTSVDVSQAADNATGAMVSQPDISAGTAAATAAAGVVGMGTGAMDVGTMGMELNMEFSSSDVGFSLDIDAALAAAAAGVGEDGGFGDVNAPQSAEDDIFAGLAFDEGMDFS